MTEVDPLDLSGEYAKSGRSTCTQCRGAIDQGTLRVGIKVNNSDKGDIRYYMWTHWKCFCNWLAKRPGRFKSLHQVSGLESLTPEEVARFKALLPSADGDAKPPPVNLNSDDEAQASAGESKSHGAPAAASAGAARGGRGVRGRGRGRQSVPVEDSSSAASRATSSSSSGGSSGSGSSGTDSGDSSASKSSANAPKSKPKAKAKAESSAHIGELVTAAAAQYTDAFDANTAAMSTLLRHMRDNVSIAELKAVLDANREASTGPTFGGREAMLLRVADGLLYGQIPRCGVCRNGRIVLSKGRYSCTGHMSQYARCSFTTDSLPRGAPLTRPADCGAWLRGLKLQQRTWVALAGGGEEVLADLQKEADARRAADAAAAAAEKGAAAERAVALRGRRAAVTEAVAAVRTALGGAACQRAAFDGHRLVVLPPRGPLARLARNHGADVPTAMTNAVTPETTAVVMGSTKLTPAAVKVVAAAHACGVPVVDESFVRTASAVGAHVPKTVAALHLHPAHSAPAGAVAAKDESGDSPMTPTAPATGAPAGADIAASDAAEHPARAGAVGAPLEGAQGEGSEGAAVPAADPLPAWRALVAARSAFFEAGGVDSDDDAASGEESDAEGRGAPRSGVSSGVRRVTVRGRAAVDEACDVEGAVVLETPTDVYSARLARVDVSTGTNSLYVLQIVCGPTGSIYLFRKWGRVGAETCPTICAKMPRDAAIAEFLKQYEEKTGGQWSDRHAFVKRPGKFQLVANEDIQKRDALGPSGRDYSGPLSAGTVSLIETIFDQRAMEATLLTLEIDAEKLPLGSLSSETIKAGYAALAAIQALIEPAGADESAAGSESDSSSSSGTTSGSALSSSSEDAAEESPAKPRGGATGRKRALLVAAVDDATLTAHRRTAALMAATNAFYTAIPHATSYAGERLPLLDSVEKVREKVRLVDQLAELSAAALQASIVEAAAAKETSVHVVDTCYQSLACDLLELASDSDPFVMVSEYVRRTHAATHTAYSLRVEAVWDCCRAGEEDAWATSQWAADPNRKLLWHGSRLTNWAGILSQGLRIAPPEAPVTGYMFGKGVYFADMVSKSANYCFHTPDKPVGLLLLCEVGLGHALELTAAKYVDPAKDLVPKVRTSCRSGAIRLPRCSTFPLTPEPPLHVGQGSYLARHFHLSHTPERVRGADRRRYQRDGRPAEQSPLQRVHRLRHCAGQVQVPRQGGLRPPVRVSAVRRGAGGCSFLDHGTVVVSYYVTLTAWGRITVTG